MLRTLKGGVMLVMDFLIGRTTMSIVSALPKCNSPVGGIDTWECDGDLNVGDIYCGSNLRGTGHFRFAAGRG
jgi:hypothetical protein